jgi:hypothetical protein
MSAKREIMRGREDGSPPSKKGKSVSNDVTSPTTYKLITGSSTMMINAKPLLIVALPLAEKIHSALQSAEKKCYDWELMVDEIPGDMVSTFP